MVLGISQDYASSHDDVQKHTALSEFPSHICLPGGEPDDIRLVLKLTTEITHDAGQDPNPPLAASFFRNPYICLPSPRHMQPSSVTSFSDSDCARNVVTLPLSRRNHIHLSYS